MAFPGAVTHRRNRRKLGRGQFPQIPTVTVAVTSTGTTNVTLTYSRPVVVRSTPGIAVAGLTINSYAIVSPTVVTCVASGTVATKAWTYAANDDNVSPSQGGFVAAASGTFP